MTDFEKGMNAYYEGDYKTALVLLRPFAEQGNAEAQFRMARMCQRAEGTLEDYHDIIKWYLLASEQGHPEAQFNLAEIYHKKKNYKEMFRWCKSAANQGFIEAQYTLAKLYTIKLGSFSIDIIRAHMWASITASNTCTNATKTKRDSAKLRDAIAKKMKTPQLAEAEKMAEEWKQKHNPTIQ